MLAVSDTSRKISCCHLISCFRGSYEACWFCNMISPLVEVRKPLLLGDHTGMSSRNDILTTLAGSCSSMPGMLDTWDSQYILGSSLQNQIFGSFHLVSGLTTGYSLGASSNANAKHQGLNSATTRKLYAEGPDIVPSTLFRDPLSHCRDITSTTSYRRDRLHEGARSLGHESSDEFSQDAAASEAAFLLDGQWESNETHSVPVAGMWEPRSPPKTPNLFRVTGGYMNFEPLKDVAVNSSTRMDDDVVHPKAVPSYHLAASDTWSAAGFGAELHDLQIPENQQQQPNNRKHPLEPGEDINFTATSLNGKNEEPNHFRNSFGGDTISDLAREDQQQLSAREAYDEFQHDQHDDISCKRLLKRSSKGGPRRPNIIKGQWTPEEDRYAHFLYNAADFTTFLVSVAVYEVVLIIHDY